MPGAATPDLLVEAFGINAGAEFITLPIPTASQIAVSPGRASLNDGFPPNCFSLVNMDGRDLNGILHMLSSNIAAQTGGQLYQFNATFALTNGGYALGAILQQAANPLSCWINLVAGNTNNPDAAGAGWWSLNLGDAVNVISLGADPTGTNLSDTAFAAAIATGRAVYAPAGTYKLSATLTPLAGQTLYGDGSATVLQFANSTIDNIVLSANSSVVRDFKINVTGGTLAEVGAVHLKSCTGCTVYNVEGAGMAGFGVWIDNASGCYVLKNYFHGFQASTDYADIHIYCTQSATAGAIGNIIAFNRCFGNANELGIAIEDPYFATADTGFPTRTILLANQIGAHSGYGIAEYMPGNGAPACDTYNEIIGNRIDGITGAIASNTASGAGIYIVGFGIGATQILNNNIFNCCISTVTRSLAPAGIGVSSVASGLTPPLIQGNIISGMTQGDGILVTVSPGGAAVIANSINMPASNNGTGPGGSPLIGAAIRVEAAATGATGAVVVNSNIGRIYGSGAGIYLFANGANLTNVTLGANDMVTANAVTLFVTQASGFNATQLNISGGSYYNTGSTDAVSLTDVIVATLSGVNASALAGRGLFVNGSTSVRVTGGLYATTGSVAVGTSGTCTNGFLDQSANIGAVASAIANAGTGFTIQWRAPAVPTAGTWAVGDTIYNSVPSATGIFLWVCTTAGVAGSTAVFKTISNT